MEARENSPQLWRHCLPVPDKSDHKYNRGHVLVLGGSIARTGAARLSAITALRVGAGLVTIASPAAAISTYAAHLTAVMLTRTDNAAELAGIIKDNRINVILAGPALGKGKSEYEKLITLLNSNKTLILDADALTLWQDNETFFSLIKNRQAPVILTPHGGEFATLFGPFDADNKTSTTLDAAKRSGAFVVYKGAQTLIASPTEATLIQNNHATPYLATAGSGDVLAGLISGLVAQGMKPYWASAAAVWIHGEAGCRFGPGLISEDLPDLIPKVLANLF